MAIGPTIENLRKKRAEEAALVAKIRELRPNDTLTQGPPDTVTDSITNFLAPIYEQMTGLSPRSSRYGAEDISGLMDFLPVVGGGISAVQAGRDFDQGNYGSAALNAGFSLLDMIPAVAAMRGGIKPAIAAIPEDARRLGQNVRQFLVNESGAVPLPFTTAGEATGKLDEITGLPLNADGTVTLYHGTTKQNAQAIAKDSRLRSAGEPDVYLTTDKTGGGYGDGTVVAVNVDPKTIQLDDEFPNGRLDFRLPVGRKLTSSPLKVSLVDSDPATERGAQIINMLTSGRADEITDQMLDMGDPVLNANLNQYLYRNYDLPMDEASRMERANSSQFNTGETLFRGDQNPDMQQFNTGQFARDGIGVTASNNADVASTYMTGKTPALYPIYARAINPISIDAGGRNWSSISADAETNYGRLNDVLPPDSYLDEENLFSLLNGNAVDWGDGSSTIMAMANTDNLSRAAQAAGFDQVRFENIVDRGGAGRYVTAAANLPSTTVMTSDPANIRSRFARFDPRLSHLRNLSAGVAPFGLLALQPNEEQY
jgi:hypothetical protein